ncbi:MAG: hypothetical protein FWE05_08675 [Defluviitaleaceae bacterium]|nr:hypothetical protein [Defluviitaleaceae bacterium]
MKLYTSILEKVYLTDLTKKEIDTLLWLLKYQDELVTTVLIHWTEIGTKVKMPIATHQP